MIGTYMKLTNYVTETCVFEKLNETVCACFSANSAGERGRFLSLSAKVISGIIMHACACWLHNLHVPDLPVPT